MQGTCRWPEPSAVYDGVRRRLLHYGMASEDDRKEYREGTDAARRFDATMQRLMKVSKDELTKREAAYQKASRAKPVRRGPIPKR